MHDKNGDKTAQTHKLLENDVRAFQRSSFSSYPVFDIKNSCPRCLFRYCHVLGHLVIEIAMPGLPLLVGHEKRNGWYAHANHNAHQQLSRDSSTGYTANTRRIAQQQCETSNGKSVRGLISRGDKARRGHMVVACGAGE